MKWKKSELTKSIYLPVFRLKAINWKNAFRTRSINYLIDTRKKMDVIFNYLRNIIHV